MQITDLLLPALIFGAIGLVLGGMLALASKLFSIEKDDRVDRIAACLPGANCGGCGFAGCAACAEAIVKGEAEMTACPGIGNDKLEQICAVMGVQKVESEPKKAVVLCSGQMDKAIYKYFFDGSKTCADVYAMQGGDKACAYACLGYGDCTAACNFGAISLENGIAKIDAAICVGCGACQKVCPKSVIDILPKGTKYAVLCRSADTGAMMKATCSAGCIGCKLCEKACAVQAVSVQNNFAVIDPQKCVGCGACAEKCPKKVIHLLGE